MAHIEKRPDRRKPWRVRYRDPTGRERSKSFLRRIHEDPSLAYRMVQTMSRRIRDLDAEVVRLRGSR